MALWQLNYPQYQAPDIAGSLISGYQAGQSMYAQGMKNNLAKMELTELQQNKAFQQDLAKRLLEAAQGGQGIQPPAGANQLLPYGPGQYDPIKDMLRRAMGQAPALAGGASPSPAPQGPSTAQGEPSPQGDSTADEVARIAKEARQYGTTQPQAATAISPERMQAMGMLSPGNIPESAAGQYLEARPSTKGSFARSMVIGTPDGRAVLLPTRADGQNLTDQQAIARFKQTGENLGTFATPQDANAYAQALANQSAQAEQPVATPESQSPEQAVSPESVSPAPQAQPTGAEQPQQAGVPVQPQDQVWTQPQPQTTIPITPRMSMQNLRLAGQQYGLTDDIISKYPVQAMQYIQQRQAQEAEMSKASVATVSDAIKSIESGKSPQERAAIATQYAQMGIISPQMAQSLSTPTDYGINGVKVTPIDKFSELVQYVDPNTGEVKSNVRSISERENTNQWIADLYGGDTKRAMAAQKKLDKLAEVTTQKIQTSVNIRQQSAKEMVDYKADQKLKTDAAGNPNGWRAYTPAEKAFFFDQQIATGQPTIRFAFGDRQSWTQYNRDFAAYASGKGISGVDVSTNKANYKALSSSLGQQQKSAGAMGGFVRNLNKQIDRVDSIGNDMVNRVGVRALDVPLRQLKVRYKGDPNEAIIGAYMLEVSNEIGKLSTGSSASISELSVGAQQKWEKVHDPNLTMRQLQKVLKETKHMANMRMDSTNEQIKQTQRQLRDLGATGKPKQDTYAAPAKTKPVAGGAGRIKVDPKKVKLY